ncbi:MAG TPA: hypothetical protein DCY14_02405, partial [Anaerolineae bacterium]|nr:hypothetical protein [Anaerolineae bacterium]
MMERNSSNVRAATPQETTRQFYTSWREGFVLPMLIGMLVFGALALIPAILASENLIVDGVFIATYLILGLVTIVRFSYQIRMSAVLLGIFIIGIIELITHSILGDGLFFFLALIAFATMMLSPRAGVVAIILNLVTFAVSGWLIQNGTITPLNPFASPAKVADWFSAGAATTMFGAAFIYGFYRLEEEFTKAQKQVDATLNTLKEERFTLEQK